MIIYLENVASRVLFIFGGLKLLLHQPYGRHGPDRRGRGGRRNKRNKFLMMKKYCRGGGGHGGNHPGAGGDGGNNDPGTGGAGMGIAA